MTEKKYSLNERQISKYANKMSLMDAIDNLDTIHQQKNQYNKKILINVNNFGDKSHKEKYAAFYWDMDEALIIANDIINGTFENTLYPSSKQAGIYQQYGGGQYSRVLNIGIKDGKYFVQVALHKPNKTKTGAILPGEKIDAHAIQLPVFEMRKFMMMLKAHIEAKLVVMLSNPLHQETVAPATVQEQPKQEVKQEVKQVEEKPANDTDDLFGDFDGLFGN